VILPHPSDFAYYTKKQIWPYDPLVREYQREKIPFLDIGPAFLASAQKGEHELEDFFGPTGHYNDRGNALVARFVYEYLQENQAMPGSPTASARSDRMSK